jgi:hypothetical protein
VKVFEITLSRIEELTRGWRELSFITCAFHQALSGWTRRTIYGDSPEMHMKF